MERSFTQKHGNQREMDENGKDPTLEEKCEYLMNIVVESRKKFGKMCVDYDQKIALVQNQMMKQQIKNVSAYRIKTKSKPEVDTDGMKRDLEEFTNEILTTQKRFDAIRQNVTNMQSVVLQQKNDKVGQKMRKQITADALLAEAKSKNKK